ncbi:hypothetical protein AVEN_155483-1 [Araneus ventricosus]|uniref:Uncharacterized protein n=1 Tax=Araneus ventricosus TaxID=182803 RepID=A0A4Y2IA74_ARAVE|nr:hypothetical protein AVEN_155483-1 [Araneus ventricosus]
MVNLCPRLADNMRATGGIVQRMTMPLYPYFWSLRVGSILDFNLWLESTILGNGMEVLRYIPWMELKIRIEYSQIASSAKEISRLQQSSGSVVHLH